MWKIFFGFAIFAGLGLFMIFKGGDKVEMGGEKHDTGGYTAAPGVPPVLPTASSAAALPIAPGSASK